MLGSLKKWMTANLPAEQGVQPLGRTDAELAMAALLVELARADFTENPREYAEIRSLLAGWLGSPHRVDGLLAEARDKADRAVSLHEFTRQLNRELTEAEKLEVVGMLWKVSMADGRIDAHEGHLVRKVAGLLHVRERDLIRLKLAVQDGNPS